MNQRPSPLDLIQKSAECIYFLALCTIHILSHCDLIDEVTELSRHGISDYMKMFNILVLLCFNM